MLRRTYVRVHMYVSTHPLSNNNAPTGLQTSVLIEFKLNISHYQHVWFQLHFLPYSLSLSRSLFLFFALSTTQLPLVTPSSSPSLPQNVYWQYTLGRQKSPSGFLVTQLHSNFGLIGLKSRLLWYCFANLSIRVSFSWLSLVYWL